MDVPFDNEADLARHVVTWLESEGFEVFQEVRPYEGGRRADIVAVRGEEVWVVETKMRLSFEVLSQCEGWKLKANIVAAAVPIAKPGALGDGYDASLRASYRKRRADYANSVANRLGVSVIRCRLTTPWHSHDEPAPEPVFKAELSLCEPATVMPAQSMREHLREEHKTWGVAGSTDNGYYTPYKATVKRLQALVKERGRVSVREAVETIEHHYGNDRSARGCLSRLARHFNIDHVSVETEGRSPVFVYVEEPHHDPVEGES